MEILLYYENDRYDDGQAWKTTSYLQWLRMALSDIYNKWVNETMIIHERNNDKKK